MNQASLTQAVSKLRIKYNVSHRKIISPEPIVGRLKILRNVVTALVKNERIETYYEKADESRGYVERLISDAVRYGERHRPTMEAADFWLTDKALIPKLFKVLAPRYANDVWPIGLPYTRMLRAPKVIYKEDLHYTEKQLGAKPMAVLELRGNPYPPLPGPVNKTSPAMLHNVLLDAAKQDYYAAQAQLHKKMLNSAVESVSEGSPESPPTREESTSSEEPTEDQSQSTAESSPSNPQKTP